jgi:SH3-like domain-containing protein
VLRVRKYLIWGIIGFITALLPLSASDHISAQAAEPFSGYEVPRFVSLRSNKVNVRRGPSSDHPIEWRYVRAGLPVEVIAETQDWRQIRDAEGYEGWVHQSLLVGKRHIVVTGDGSPKNVAIREEPDQASRMVARAQLGVIGQLVQCADDWCLIQVENISGWVHRSLFWGVYAHENIN